jgi:hypothetical protein
MLCYFKKGDTPMPKNLPKDGGKAAARVWLKHDSMASDTDARPARDQRRAICRENKLPEMRAANRISPVALVRYDGRGRQVRAQSSAGAPTRP